MRKKYLGKIQYLRKRNATVGEGSGVEGDSGFKPET